MMVNIQSESAASNVDLLVRAEAALLRHLEKLVDDTAVSEIAGVLRDLSYLRGQLEEPGPFDIRKSARIHELAVVQITQSPGHTDEIALYDISAGGAAVACDTPPPDGQHLTLTLPGAEGASIRAVVRETRNGITHLRFEAVDKPQVVSLLKYITRHLQRY